MQKYGGALIYQFHDDEGILEIVETHHVRSLHFGSISRQSSLDVHNPHDLHLEYARTMMCGLLFKDIQDDEILIIGLGGGSIVKYLLHHFPNCYVKAIEYRKSVVKIARSFFDLPLDARLKIVVDDGARYVKSRTQSECQLYSFLFIDAFDHEGLAPAICNVDFFKNCKTLLKSDGILLVNLWGGVSRPQFRQVALWLGNLFNWQVIFLPVQGRGNIIALAFNQPKPHYHFQTLRNRALFLEQNHRIEFNRFLKELIKHNASVVKNIIHK